MERMEAFFTARVDCYDAHMLHEVEGYAEGCRMAAGLLPETVLGKERSGASSNCSRRGHQWVQSFL